MKKNIDINLLKEMYCNDNMTCKEIGAVAGMNEKTVALKVKENNLVRNYRNILWLMHKHHTEKLTCYEMAEQCKCSIDAILDNMKKFGIEIYNYNRRYKLNENFFSEINTEEKAYWLGFLMADGYVSKSGYQIRLRLALADREHIVKFLNSINSSHNIKEVIAKLGDNEHTLSQVDINSVVMCNDLSKLGVINGKANNETMPELQEDLVRHFIRGYFDGDGSLSYGYRKRIRDDKEYMNRYCKASILGSSSILSSISNIVNLEFDEISMNVFQKGNENIHVISCSDSKAIKFLDWIYKDSAIYLDRKKNKFMNCITELDYKI